MKWIFSRKERRKRKLSQAIEYLTKAIEVEQSKIDCLVGALQRHTEAGHVCRLTEAGFESIAEYKGKIHHFRFLIVEAKRQLGEL